MGNADIIPTIVTFPDEKTLTAIISGELITIVGILSGLVSHMKLPCGNFLISTCAGVCRRMVVDFLMGARFTCRHCHL